MRKIFVLGNGVDWCEMSLRRLVSKDNVYLINDKLPLVKKKKIAKIHFSNRLNHRIIFPFKSIWFKNIRKYIKENSDVADEIILIVYDWNTFGGEKLFSDYIRKTIKQIKLVYVFTNIVKGSYAYSKGIVRELGKWYDVVFAFDMLDAKKYGFAYSPLIYDADPDYNKLSEESKSNLVFYVGQAKDRLKGLLASFEKLKQIGIKCKFNIANVKSEDQKYSQEITYNKFMTYNEAVNNIRNATCLIDVIQGDSTGLTIKTCEAVCYDKKLLTTNIHVVDYPFYDSRFIRVIKSVDDIDQAFFEQNREVLYSEEGKRYFSAERFLERLDVELHKLDSHR